MQDVMIFLFQSTRPVRGATVLDDVAAQESHVSIHAPHAGRDLVKALRGFRCRCFNPRAPCGARHTEPSDRTVMAGFNPRAPCGARPCR